MKNAIFSVVWIHPNKKCSFPNKGFRIVLEFENIRSEGGGDKLVSPRGGGGGGGDNHKKVR